MKTANDRLPNERIRMRAKFAWQRKRLRSFVKNPTFDLRFKLIAMSIASPLIAVVGGALASYGLVTAGYAFAFCMSGAALGLVVLATLTSRFLDRHFAEFKSAKILALAMIALATYVAHGKAVGEVNAIFQLDASALPHATTAASAMVIATWIYMAAVLPTLIGSAVLMLYYYGKSEGGNALIAFAILMCAVLWAGLLNVQAVPAHARKSNLYQIALEMDFNKRSHCSGVPMDSEGVVFIGPDQRRAIVAPRLVEIERSPRTIFTQVQVPENFDIVNCP
ncbi:MAG: hypothetical protein V4857_05750 [Pseudomonadota bacterium]